MASAPSHADPRIPRGTTNSERHALRCALPLAQRNNQGNERRTAGKVSERARVEGAVADKISAGRCDVLRSCAGLPGSTGESHVQPTVLPSRPPAYDHEDPTDRRRDGQARTRGTRHAGKVALAMLRSYSACIAHRRGRPTSPSGIEAPRSCAGSASTSRAQSESAA